MMTKRTTGTPAVPKKTPADLPTPAAAKKRKADAPRRDPARTRASILRAAVAEFSAKGYSGARTEEIARRAKSNIRMLYHYFGGKDELYVHVLEEVLGRLRMHELQLDFSDADPLDGLLQMFDFIDAHFSAHPELRNLLAFENLNRATHLKRSKRIPEISSPVLRLIGGLLQRGEAKDMFRPGIDPLHLYVAMVSLAYYARSHAHTLSRIFQQDMLAPDWQQAHNVQTRQMLVAFLARPSSAAASSSSPSTSSRKKTP